jgi:hypothetical protein
MKMRTLLIASAAVSLIAGTGFAFAQDADGDSASDQTYRDQSNAPDQSMTDQGYSQHWFSSTGYGPNDDQADQTRALNRDQLKSDHTGPSDDRDDEDMPGPSDNSAPADADDDDRSAPPPADDR